MSRSRSSFDLSGAIATATSLSVVVPEEQPPAHYRGVPLVSFGPTAAGTVVPPPPDPATAEAPVTTRESPRPPPAPPPPAPAPAVEEAPAAPHAEVEAGPTETARRPPKLPDLSEIKSPTVRCQKIIEWIVEAVGASDVFIADAAGLPLGGSIADAEARLGATGVVASAVAHLAAAIPGNTSALFEMHVGDGPFFQLIGFDVAAQSYVVGFQRPTPLGFRQAHAVRLACRHALGLGNDGGHPHSAGHDHDGGDPQPSGRDGELTQPSGEADPATHPRGHVAMEEAHADRGGET
jgi:hypothetical protein